MSARRRRIETVLKNDNIWLLFKLYMVLTACNERKMKIDTTDHYYAETLKLKFL